MKDLHNLSNCWLNPGGRIITKDREFFGDYAWHEELALCILRDIWGLEDSAEAFEKVHQKFSNTATEELEGKGYVRLHGFGGLPPKWILPCDHRLTESQESTIQSWCIDNNVKYESCFAK